MQNQPSILEFYLNTFKTNSYKLPQALCLSKTAHFGKVCAVAVNPATSREKLNKYGKQAVPFAHRAKAVFFTLAFSLYCLFSMVSKGKARFIAAASYWQFLTPCPLLATPNREKLAAASN